MIEDFLGSKGKIKILKVLAKYGQVNITSLVKLTGLRYSLVRKHLHELIDAGYVEEINIGRTRIYSLRYDNPRLLLVLDLIKALEENESKYR